LTGASAGGQFETLHDERDLSVTVLVIRDNALVGDEVGTGLGERTAVTRVVDTGVKAMLVAP